MDVWPEILESIKSTGIENMEIYNLGDKLFMIIEVNDQFSFEKKRNMDADNPIVQAWETLMSKYQKVSSSTKKNEKWLLMERIFNYRS